MSQTTCIYHSSSNTSVLSVFSVMQYLRYMTFVLETAIKNMKNGQEQWVWILDMTGTYGLRFLVAASIFMQ